MSVVVGNLHGNSEVCEYVTTCPDLNIAVEYVAHLRDGLYVIADSRTAKELLRIRVDGRLIFLRPEGN